MSVVRSWSAVLPALFLLCAACDDGEAKLKEVQSKADERVKKAERDAAEKLSQLQKQLDQLKAESEAQAAKLKTEADEAISKAQANADDQAKAAESALKKAREAYKAEGRNELSQINKEVSELAAKSAKAPAKLKAQTTKTMQQVVTLQKQIAKDLSAFDTAALDGLQAAKSKLTGDLAKMKATVRAARAKLG